MTAPLLVTTTPREITPRWIHAGDQIAVMATHYDPAHEVTPVRTADLAKIDDSSIVEWWSVAKDPEHPDPVDVQPAHSWEHPEFPLSGFRLTICPLPDAWPATDVQPGVELYAGDREQFVIREQVAVEAWDIGCRGLDGGCYLPAGHAGDHDRDHDTDVTPEHDEDEDEGCQGHESLAGADMGVTVYCNGTCS